MAFGIPPDLIARLIQGGQLSFPTSGGLPGGKGGGMPMPTGGAPMPQGLPQQAQVPDFATPMSGTPPGQMPNIRAAMMQNVMGTLGQPNFGIPQFAPRAGGIGQPSAPPVGYLPPGGGGPPPIASGGNNIGNRFGYRRIFAR